MTVYVLSIQHAHLQLHPTTPLHATTSTVHVLEIGETLHGGLHKAVQVLVSSPLANHDRVLVNRIRHPDRLFRVSIVMGVARYSWMGRENPSLKWMMTGGIRISGKLQMLIYKMM